MYSGFWIKLNTLIRPTRINKYMVGVSFVAGDSIYISSLFWDLVIHRHLLRFFFFFKKKNLPPFFLRACVLLVFPYGNRS